MAVCAMTDFQFSHQFVFGKKVPSRYDNFLIYLIEQQLTKIPQVPSPDIFRASASIKLSSTNHPIFFCDNLNTQIKIYMCYLEMLYKRKKRKITREWRSWYRSWSIFLLQASETASKNAKIKVYLRRNLFPRK